jgi:sporulation protein YlmC with PRC-barrel domain
MYLNSISQIGDVILVEDEDVIEDVDIDLYSSVINSEVVTETGEPLGKVRDFQFNLENGELTSLTIASLGYPQIPEQLISTYELSVEEVVSSGPNRIIVFEGAEERLTQITEGVLERLGIGRPPWDRDDEDIYYTPTTPPENQLPTGVPVRPVAPPLPKREPVMEENWNDEQWEEERPITPPPMRRKAEAIPYEEESSLEEDMWDDGDDYRPQRVNIPKKQAMPEYDYE